MSKRNSGNNPEEKTDLRIRRTKKSIRDAFFELIDENGFDSVTVKDITDRALISRNTFICIMRTSLICLTKSAMS